MSDKKKEARIGRRPFTESLQDMAGGDADKELTRQLCDLVSACTERGKKGKMVVTFDVVPGPKLVQIGVSIKTTVPQPALEATQFFVDDTGSLHRENPRQGKLFDGPKVVSNEPDGEN